MSVCVCGMNEGDWVKPPKAGLPQLSHLEHLDWREETPFPSVTNWGKTGKVWKSGMFPPSWHLLAVPLVGTHTIGTLPLRLLGGLHVAPALEREGRSVGKGGPPGAPSFSGRKREN